MQTEIIFTGWEVEPDVHGEAAMMKAGKTALDMAVTPLEEGGVECDLIDGAEVIWRQWMPTPESGKRAVETAARRRFLRAV